MSIIKMEGAKELIEMLHEKGVKLAVATGGFDKKKVGEVLRPLGVDSYFLASVGHDEIAKGKPAPDIFLLAAKKLGVAPADCLVLEDAPNGVAAAKRAGMLVYGVNQNNTLRNQLKEAGADNVFSSLDEVAIV